MIGYGLCYIHMMDVCMNAFILANYVNTFARVAIGVGCLRCNVLSAEPFLFYVSNYRLDFYM